MSKSLYRLINPAVSWLLRSPVHRLMSRNTMLLSFTGRKSGRVLSTPVSYYVQDKIAHCFTARSYTWWHNLEDGQTTELVIQGSRFKSSPILESLNHETIANGLEQFLRAVPRDASHAGVALDRNGQPDIDDVHRVAPNLVYLKFPLENYHA